MVFFWRPRERNRNASKSYLAVASCPDPELKGRLRTTDPPGALRAVHDIPTKRSQENDTCQQILGLGLMSLSSVSELTGLNQNMLHAARITPDEKISM